MLAGIIIIAFRAQDCALVPPHYHIHQLPERVLCYLLHMQMENRFHSRTGLSSTFILESWERQRHRERGREGDRDNYAMFRIRIQMQIPKLILFAKTFTLCCIIGPNPFAGALSVPGLVLKVGHKSHLEILKRRKRDLPEGEGRRGEGETSDESQCQ